jgi:hemerythrin-like domain-containing protein
MHIYDTLTKDHREFERLIDEAIARGQNQSQNGQDAWRAPIERLRDGLLPHAHAEEAVLYNALRDEGQKADPSKGLIADAYREHLMLETELRGLLAMKKIDETWTKAVENFRKDLKHHLQQEETRIFAEARKVFSDEESRQMNEAFLKLKPEMAKTSESIVASTKELIVNLMPARLRDKFRKGFDTRGQRAA